MAQLRVDAERNRRSLIDAARVEFAARGLDAPLDEIARRAGVGNATLYRRFPTRDDLVAAVFVETLEQVVAESDLALARSDPGAAFGDHVRFLCDLQSQNRALADLLTTRVGSPALEALRGRALAQLVALIQAAQRAGTLRPDFSHEDVVVVLMANAGLLERTAATAPTAWRRHLAFVLDGLRTPAPALSVPAPGRDEIVDTMDAWAVRRGCAASPVPGVPRH